MNIKRLILPLLSVQMVLASVASVYAQEGDALLSADEYVINEDLVLEEEYSLTDGNEEKLGDDISADSKVFVNYLFADDSSADSAFSVDDCSVDGDLSVEASFAEDGFVDDSFYVDDGYFSQDEGIVSIADEEICDELGDACVDELISSVWMSDPYKNAELNIAIYEFKKTIKPEMSDFEKVLCIIKFLSAKASYERGDNDQTAYGALIEGKAVCAGYADAFNVLAEAAGLESRYVSSAERFHAWNMVKVDGKKYYIDPTALDGNDHIGWGTINRTFLSSAKAFRESGLLPADVNVRNFGFSDKWNVNDANSKRYDKYGSDEYYGFINGFEYIGNHEWIFPKMVCTNSDSDFASDIDIMKYKYSGSDLVESGPIYKLHLSKNCFNFISRSGIGQRNGKLYFADLEKIYEYDIKTKDCREFYDISKNPNCNGGKIEGVDVVDNYLIYSIEYDNSYYKQYKIKLGDKEKLKGKYIAPAQSGNIYLYRDGVIQKSVTGLYEDKRMGLVYLKKGKIDTSFSKLYKDKKRGTLVFFNGFFADDYNRLYEKSYDEVYYVRNGKVDYKFTGIYEDDYNKGFPVVIEKGKKLYGYTGAYKLPDGTIIAVRQSVVDRKYTGISFSEKYGSWLFNKGKVNKTYSDIYKTKYDGSYLIKKGKVDKGFNGRYYSKKYKKYFTIRNGKVI